MNNSGRDIKIKTINGRKYAYDMISFWDKEQKKYRKKSIYLGVVTDVEKKEYTPKYSKNRNENFELILNFGDVYSIHKVIENSVFKEVFKNVLPTDTDTLMNLICYKLLKSSSMQYAQTWAAGSYVSKLFAR